jgi:formylmethanofuran dehydrogenase subunit B
MPEVITAIGRTAAELPTLLGVLRAHIAGRPAGKVAKPVVELAAALQAARFGVAVWSAQTLDELAIEMLFGLIKDLNAKTRFTGLPLAAGDNAFGVQQACGWMTGFPVRTGFARGYPEHDPWRFDAKRVVAGGEADCTMWVAAYQPASPNWKAAIPTIALSAGAAPSSSQVHIQVGRPALDHDAVEHDAATGMIVARAASHNSALPSVAETIARIAAALPAGGPWPC